MRPTVATLAMLSITVACHSSTSPAHQAVDSISVKGTWIGVDSLRDSMTLILSQTGDSVTGTGNIDNIAIRVAGLNLNPQHCAPGACLVPPELSFQITDLAGDTLFVGGHFAPAPDTNHIGAFDVLASGPPPGLPFARADFTLARQVATLALRRKR
jgi:hypothetical protein